MENTDCSCEDLHQLECPNNNAVSSTRRLKKLEKEETTREPNLEKLINHLIGQVIKTLRTDPKNTGKYPDPVMIRKYLDEMILDAIRKHTVETAEIDETVLRFADKKTFTP